MTTVTLQGYIHTRINEWDGTREFTFAKWDDWKQCGYVLVGPCSFDYGRQLLVYVFH